MTTRKKPKGGPSAACLIVLRGFTERRCNPLDGRVYNIGRGFENDLVFAEDSVSRRHACVTRKGNRYWLQDRESGNGTWVNNKSVRRVELREGDLIGVGQIIMMFTQGGAGSLKTRAGLLPVTDQTPVPGSSLGRVRFLLTRTRRRRVLSGIAGIGLLLLTCLVAFSSPDEIQVIEERAQARREARAQAGKKLVLVRELVKQSRWEEAGLEVGLALQIDPGNQRAREYDRFIREKLVR